MSRRRVMVTGIGVVSPLGPSREAHFAGLLAGASGVVATDEALAYRSVCPFEAPAAGFDRRCIANRMLRKLLTRSGGFAVAAAGQALEQGGLLGHAEALAACGVFAGSVAIDFDPEIFLPAFRESLDSEGRLDVNRFAKRGLHLIDPMFLVRTLPNGGLGGIAIEHQATGMSLNLANGPVSGMQAVASAVRMLRHGAVDVALAGGYDSQRTMDSIAEHLVAGRVATAPAPGPPCRPFDRQRSGFVPGEGAAFLLLETEESARARGARCHAEVLGVGQSTRAEPDGRAEALAAAARTALQDAGRRAEDVDVLFVDGLASDCDDGREAEAAERAFGGRAVAFTAATGATGFTGAASGAFSLVHAVEALRGGVVPPLTGCLDLDPRCRLKPIPQAESSAPGLALAWSSDRGVKNAAVVVGRCSA